MNVEVRYTLQGNRPENVEVRLPDWSQGGVAETIPLTFYEALQLRDQLCLLLGPGR